MEIKRVFDILEKLKTFAPKDDILNAKENKQWKKYSLANFTENANYVSSALINLGLKENDVVAIMSNNCPQWNFVDFGAQQAAVLTAPVYPTISSGDLKFILNHSEAKVIFISDKNVFQKLQTLAPELLHLKHIFSFAKIDGARHFDEFIELGKSNFDAEKINSIKKNISEDGTLKYPFTSGYADTQNIGLAEAARRIMLQYETNSAFLAENENMRMRYTSKIKKETDIKNLNTISAEFLNESGRVGAWM